MTSQIDGQDEIASVTTVVGSTQRPNEARLFRFMGTVVSCLVAAMFLPACGTLAQEIAIQRPPYYVGEPVVLQITASGIEGAAPDCRYVGPSNPELQVLGPQVSKSSFSNMQIINGRVTKSESNDYRFSFQVTATVAGELSIGPFELEVDGKTTRIDALRRTFGQLENDPDVLVEVELADDSIYVGQEVPVTIRWGFAGDRDALDHAFNALQIRSPLFDQFDFLDVSPTTRQTLTIATAQGNVLVDGEASKEQRNGREFIVVTGKRMMRPKKAGEYQAIPVTCRTEKITAWQRSIFSVQPARTEPAVAAGPPLSFVVRPLPQTDRPLSFAGAVGRGFSFDVAANRSVVRVGDPISLEITLAGDGSLEDLPLPDLSACGLDSAMFQLPSEPPVGSFTGKQKQFKLSVRAKQEGIEQIPALEFSWFDPEKEKYVTTSSKPIALQVMPAQIVTAANVFSGSTASSEQTTGTANGEDKGSLGSKSISLIGANLAIEQSAEKLQGRSQLLLNATWFSYAMYPLGVLSLAVALILRQGKTRDPRKTQALQRLRRWRQQLSSARHLPLQAAAEAIGGAAREMLPYLSASSRTTADELIAECDALAYAGNVPDDQARAQQLAERALSIVSEVQ